MDIAGNYYSDRNSKRPGTKTDFSKRKFTYDNDPVLDHIRSSCAVMVELGHRDAAEDHLISFVSWHYPDKVGKIWQTV